MKTVIAGGRDYVLTGADCVWLDTLGITEVVSGGARGADRGGEEWALGNNIDLTIMPAKWIKHGKAAGPIRNREMAEYAEAVVLFPGGKGTDSMAREAKRMDLPIYKPL